MSVFDQLAGQVLGSLGQGEEAQGGLQGVLLQALLGAVHNSEGGVGGLLARLSGGGLAEQVASWIGSGENLPVSADQLQGALGGDLAGLGAIVAQLGIPQEQIATHLAQLLPQVLSQLAPGGQPAGGDALAQGLSVLGGLFGKA